MKKVLIFLFGLSMILSFSASKKDKIVIPKDAIRYRIIANSNEFKDQEEKLMINTLVEPILNDILKNSPSIESSRNNIVSSIPKIENVVSKYNGNYDITYGINHFPEKTYNDITYEEGDYESLVITLGEGKGDNWWCVLFPPLCLLEAHESDLDEATYSLYIKDVLERFN